MSILQISYQKISLKNHLLIMRVTKPLKFMKMASSILGKQDRGCLEKRANEMRVNKMFLGIKTQERMGLLRNSALLGNFHLVQILKVRLVKQHVLSVNKLKINLLMQLALKRSMFLNHKQLLTYQRPKMPTREFKKSRKCFDKMMKEKSKSKILK